MKHIFKTCVLALLAIATLPLYGQVLSKKTTAIIQCMLADSCKMPITLLSPQGGAPTIILPVAISNYKEDTLVFTKGSFAAREYNIEAGLLSFVIDYDFDGTIDATHIIDTGGKTLAYFPAKLMTQEERDGFQKYFDISIGKALGLIGPDGKHT